MYSSLSALQIDRCLFHNKSPSPSSSYGFDSSCLAVDHHCAKSEFPCETIQVGNSELTPEPM